MIKPGEPVTITRVGNGYLMAPTSAESDDDVMVATSLGGLAELLEGHFEPGAEFMRISTFHDHSL